MGITIAEVGLTKAEQVELSYMLLQGYTHVNTTRLGITIVWKGTINPSGEFIKESSKLLNLGKYAAIKESYEFELVEISLLVEASSLVEI
ncbi:hypothetical protein ABD91_21295 [Lysinibacillus sphaericus]|uniref:hypothetical protein n=1 Tax=Lysinibacillus sphaericus TaxID=1421 RepID=UPI0018CC8CFD|nr:hypothetical protein [Lysinibacillus sphaericus]MBG9693275.1 hypothetical protein [Lysinibacillus sphaericus]